MILLIETSSGKIINHSRADETYDEPKALAKVIVDLHHPGESIVDFRIIGGDRFKERIASGDPISPLTTWA